MLTGNELRYHSDFVDWNFGKLSVMREINLAIEGGYHYYYMGIEREIRFRMVCRLRFADNSC